ncbi:MAG: CbiX/SirB N-terminal domain-containing protein, partial [Burkholderiaceae bacterium]|nr:CbiX/SirB N-terminal domain-containing protein [Burkholderiaceae bacterium]
TTGIKFVCVIPVFLGSGGHVRRDVPQLVQQAMRTHPGVKFEVASFVGDADAVLEAIAEYASTAKVGAD